MSTETKPSTAEKTLREALVDARSYVEAVVLNSGDTKRRTNYRGCLARIDTALSTSNDSGDGK